MSSSTPSAPNHHLSSYQEQYALIEQAWEHQDKLSPLTQSDEVWAIQSVLTALDEGRLRVADKIDQVWCTHEWIKKAILLSFRISHSELTERPLFGFDKIPSKFENWTSADFDRAKFRVVPGAIVRKSAFIDHQVILMPSFVNVGAYVGQGTMVDSYVTVGSCAQIGANCHLSSNVVIGGVLEPLQASPVIIEDNCFIGAQSAVVEGVIVEQGAVIGMGIMVGGSTPIVHRETGEISYGRIPAYGVVVPGMMPAKVRDGVQTVCAVIVKTVDAQTRARTAINELLRM